MTGGGGLSRPGTKAGRLQRAVLALLRKHQARDEPPTSGRFLFYELEQRGLIAKRGRSAPRDGRPGRRGSDQELADALTRLRERAVIPWDWMSTRRGP